MRLLFRFTLAAGCCRSENLICTQTCPYKHIYHRLCADGERKKERWKMKACEKSDIISCHQFQAGPICIPFIFHESFILWSIKLNCSVRAIWQQPMRSWRNRRSFICYCLINAINKVCNKWTHSAQFTHHLSGLYWSWGLIQKSTSCYQIYSFTV